MAKKKTTNIHPYNQIATFEEVKKNITKNFFFTAKLLQSPLCTNFLHLENNKDLNSFYYYSYKDLKKDNIKSLYEYNQTIRSLEDIKLLQDIQERYLIIYYFNNPIESYRDKVEYFQTITKIEYPKKYIYDFIEQKEITEEKALKLNSYELYLLGYGFNEVDFFKHGVKITLKNNYSKLGLNYLEKFYYNIPKEDRTEEQKGYTPELEALEILLANNDIFYNKPSIKCYKDFINFKIERLNKILSNNNQKQKDIKNKLDLYFKESSSNLEKLKQDIENKFNASFNELLSFDVNAHAFLSMVNNLKEAKDFFNDIDRLINVSKSKDPLEKAYFYLIQLEPLINEETIINTNIKENELILKGFDKPNTRSTKLELILTPFFNSAYMYRNNALVDLEEYTKQGAISTYVNNIMNGLVLSGLSFKPLTTKEEEIYKQLFNEINSCKEEIEALKKASIDPNCNYNENIVQQEQLNIKLNKLNEAYSNKNFIEITIPTTNGDITELRKVIINGGGENASFRKNDNNDTIELILDTFTRSYPRKIETKVNNNRQAHSIAELTPIKANKMNSLLRKIFEKGSQNPEEPIITISFEEIKNLWSSTSSKRVLEDTRLFLEILSRTRLEKSTLKIGKKSETFSSLALISDYEQKKNQFSITLGTIIQTIYKHNTSKIYNNPNAIYNSAEEGLIDFKAENLLNQPIFKGTELLNSRKVAYRNFIEGVPSLKASTDTKSINRDLIEKGYNSFDNLNKNDTTNIFYVGIEGLKNATNLQNLLETKITVKHKKDYVKGSIKQRENKIKSKAIKKSKELAK